MNVPRGTMPDPVDVAVIGAGHAGCEAALAAARLGRATALVTLRREGVAAMPCNPAIGGLGKSQIVREIDALGGEMGRVADAAAIHYRRLNLSKGPAVRARRVQCDLGVYHRIMLETLDATGSLWLIEGAVERLSRTGDPGFRLELATGKGILARTVVVTTGTFLRGLMHVGLDSCPGGRLGDPPSVGLSESLRELGFETGRLKTGTPARLEAASVLLEGLEQQPSEQDLLPFSHEGRPRAMPPVACFVTRTNPATHAIIRAALDRSPLFTGVIQGRGPRYCPSIEDKVVRFPDRESHQVVLEPTDLSGKVLYPNGISTSLPRDVQLSLVRSIAGLEEARIVEHGYAIEYDYVPPTQLRPSLEARGCPGLFLAGQINGTSGYEEAAGQGLVAGVNAALSLAGREPMVLGRDEAYIGVMIDDLVSRGTTEPYRMFSSRAEFRLLLREDNAVPRLADWADRIGLVPGEVRGRRRAKTEEVEALVARLATIRAPADAAGRRPSLEELLRRPGVTLDHLAPHLGEEHGQDVFEQAEVRIKYRGYIERQIREAEKLKTLESRTLPGDLDYDAIPGLSRELAEKLAVARPATLGQASRVDGMTPAAVMVLSIWLARPGKVPRGTPPSKDR